jgi:hypothetical protein
MPCLHSTEDLTYSTEARVGRCRTDAAKTCMQLINSGVLLERTPPLLSHITVTALHLNRTCPPSSMPPPPAAAAAAAAAARPVVLLKPTNPCKGVKSPPAAAAAAAAAAACGAPALNAACCAASMVLAVATLRPKAPNWPAAAGDSRMAPAGRQQHTQQGKLPRHNSDVATRGVCAAHLASGAAVPVAFYKACLCCSATHTPAHPNVNPAAGHLSACTARTTCRVIHRSKPPGAALHVHLKHRLAACCIHSTAGERAAAPQPPLQTAMYSTNPPQSITHVANTQDSAAKMGNTAVQPKGLS